MLPIEDKCYVSWLVCKAMDYLLSNVPLRGRGIFGVGAQRHMASLEDSDFITGPDVLMLNGAYKP